MGLIKIIQNLCTPAYVYLVITIISNIYFLINYGSNYTDYCRGHTNCINMSIIGLLIGEWLVSIIWITILNIVCKKGHTEISWVLMILPYFSIFFVLAYNIYEARRNEIVKYDEDEVSDLDDTEIESDEI
jgi:hypothetical protein